MASQDYYNPIIQAMVETSRQKIDREKLAAQIEQHKEQQKTAERHLDIVQRQAESQVEHQKAQIDVQKALHQMQIEQHRVGLISGLADLSAKGVNLSEFVKPESRQVMPTESGPAQVPGTGQIQIPGLSFPISEKAFPTPQARLASEVARTKAIAGAQAGGAAAAVEPFNISEEQRKFTTAKDLKKFDQDFQVQLHGMDIASHEKISKMSRDTQIAVSNAANATHLQVAGMQYVPSPENLRAMVVGGATGMVKLNPANPQERAALGSIINMGFRPPNDADINALKQSETLRPIFSKLEDFAMKYLPSEKGGKTGAQIGAYIQGQVIKHTEFPSDVKNELMQVKSQAIQVGKTIEGMTGGRIPIRQMELALEAMTSGGITREQALGRVQYLKDVYQNQMQHMILGGMPDSQKELIYRTRGILPSWLVIAPTKNTQGHVLDDTKSLEVGRPIYK